MQRIVILPGDGIGPEVAEQARLCLASLSVGCGLALEFEARDFGGAAIDRHGAALPDATLDACRAADAILMGAVGGAKWDSAPERPEAGLLKLRGALGLYANLLPARVIDGLEHLSPLKPAGSIAKRSRMAKEAAARLAEAIRAVIAEAIAAGGSSLRDHRQADGSLGYFQHSFAAYDREGEPCRTPGCGGHIKRIVQSGRSTFYCPACQK